MIIDLENRLVFYYPMTAITTIFMHIVCNPLGTSVSNDIALMDAVVGFFGRLEYITSGEAAFTRMGELVQQARCIVLSAQEDAERAREPNQLANQPQIESITTTVAASSITNEQIISRSGEEPRDVVVDEIGIHSTAYDGQGAGQERVEHPTTDGASRGLGGTSTVSSNVELAALASSQDAGHAEFVDSAEHLERSLRDLTQPLTGLFPEEALNVDWFDAWMIPRQSGRAAFDRELAHWT